MKVAPTYTLESKLRAAKVAIAIWAISGLGFAGIVGLYLGAFACDAPGSDSSRCLLIALGIASVLSLPLVGLPLLYMKCLRRYTRTARVFFWAYSGLLLIWLPIGTIVGIISIRARNAWMDRSGT